MKSKESVIFTGVLVATFVAIAWISLTALWHFGTPDSIQNSRTKNELRIRADLQLCQRVLIARIDTTNSRVIPAFNSRNDYQWYSQQYSGSEQFLEDMKALGAMRRLPWYYETPHEVVGKPVTNIRIDEPVIIVRNGPQGVPVAGITMVGQIVKY